MLLSQSKHRKRGKGIVNTLINKLPFEIHLPKYNYCGPGTKLQERLKRGDPGINPLDAACKEHDIAYSRNNSLKDRHKADFVLENKAWERVKSKDASLGEKAAAWSVTTTMKAKRKMGMGTRKPTVSFKRHIVDKVNNTLKKGVDTGNLKKSSLIALRAARAAIKKVGGRSKVRVPRIIPFESKRGGILPLLPILGALGALGSLAGGTSAIAKTIIDAKNAKKALEEQNRHNKAVEQELGKKGSGLFMRKNKCGGYGLYLKQKPKNYQ